LGQKPKFDLSLLKEEAAQVKRRILERVKKGEVEPKALIKTDCLALFLSRPRLGLQSTRPLYDKDKDDPQQPGPRQKYLDKWFAGVLVDAQKEWEKIIPPDRQEEPTAVRGVVLKELHELRAKAEVQARTIQEYRKALDVLRAENQELSVQVLSKRRLPAG